MVVNIYNFKRWRGWRGWRVKTVLRGKKEKILNPFLQKGNLFMPILNPGQKDLITLHHPPPRYLPPFHRQGESLS